MCVCVCVCALILHALTLHALTLHALTLHALIQHALILHALILHIMSNVDCNVIIRMRCARELRVCASRVATEAPPLASPKKAR